MNTPLKKHLLIVDGHHLMYRAYWAIPRTMKNTKGEQVNTTFGVASMLLLMLKTEQPDSILFCFDADEDTFRHKEYAEYKAGRSATPDDFYVQIPRTLSLIDTFGIKSISGGGFEADDFACSYAKEAEKSGYRVTVVSGDRDLLQLASDNIRISIPHKGYHAAEYLGPADVFKKYGVTPEQIPSYKGLVGDSSDNLPGVKGIGPKAAEALLQKYGTLESIYEHLSEIKEAWRSKLAVDKDQAFFCERMALLKSDISLTVPITDLAYSHISTTPILELFSALDFSLVTRRFSQLLESAYGRARFILDASSDDVVANFTSSQEEKVLSRIRSDGEQSQLQLL